MRSWKSLSGGPGFSDSLPRCTPRARGGAWNDGEKALIHGGVQEDSLLVANTDSLVLWSGGLPAKIACRETNVIVGTPANAAPARKRRSGRYGMRDNGKRGWCRFHVAMLNTMQPATIDRFHRPDGGPFSGSLRLRSSVREERSRGVRLSMAITTQ